MSIPALLRSSWHDFLLAKTMIDLGKFVNVGLCFTILLDIEDLQLPEAAAQSQHAVLHSAWVLSCDAVEGLRQTYICSLAKSALLLSCCLGELLN